MIKKKYILKPGKHQFAPKSPPIHDNDKLTDEEAAWYLEKYPHIIALFVPENKSVKSSSSIGEIQNNNEDLLTTN